MALSQIYTELARKPWMLDPGHRTSSYRRKQCAGWALGSSRKGWPAASSRPVISMGLPAAAAHVRKWMPWKSWTNHLQAWLQPAGTLWLMQKRGGRSGVYRPAKTATLPGDFPALATPPPRRIST